MLSRVSGIHLVFHIVARCCGTKLQCSSIFLAIQLQTLYLLGLLARTEDEHTSCQWVKSSCMSYLHATHAYLF